jgi:multisubunit Na+/H+ antiporter MnhG subunit
MEHLAEIGLFFTGLGMLLSSFGIFWFVSIYKKAHQSEGAQIN